jgi:hypothetical protein
LFSFSLVSITITIISLTHSSGFPFFSLTFLFSLSYSIPSFIHSFPLHHSLNSFSSFISPLLLPPNCLILFFLFSFYLITKHLQPSSPLIFISLSQFLSFLSSPFSSLPLSFSYPSTLLSTLIFNTYSPTHYPSCISPHPLPSLFINPLTVHLSSPTPSSSVPLYLHFPAPLLILPTISPLLIISNYSPLLTSYPSTSYSFLVFLFPFHSSFFFSNHLLHSAHYLLNLLNSSLFPPFSLLSLPYYFNHLYFPFFLILLPLLLLSPPSLSSYFSRPRRRSLALARGS